MPDLPASDESFRLRRAGWSAGDAASLGAAGELVWLVAGSNGENLIRAYGKSRDEAWRMACEQAAAVGMLGQGDR